MIKRYFLVLIYLLLFVPGLLAQKNEGADYDPNYKYSPDQLQYDFIIFRWLLEQIHPGLDWYTPKARLDEMMDSTFMLLETDSLTEREFYQLLSPIIAKIHCGHTIIDPSYFYQDLGKRFPLDLKFIQGKAFIRYNYTEREDIPLGSEVLSINGQSIPDLLQQLFPAIPSDATHPAGKYATLEEDFQNYYDLLIAQPDTFVLECVHIDTKEKFTLTLDSEDSDKLRTYNKRYLDDLLERKTLDFKLLQDDNTAILEVNSFYPVDIKFERMKFGRFLKNSFAQIKSNKIQNLIIDLRRNGGGEMLYVNDLFSYLANGRYQFLDRVEVSTDHQISLASLSELSEVKVHNPRRVAKTDSGTYVVRAEYYNFLDEQKPKKLRFKGNVYVLISHKSFSAASLFATLVYAHKRATIIGEESGGGAQGLNGGDFIDISLPNTNMLLEIPVEKWFKEIEGYPDTQRGIKPHHEVYNSIDDILAGKDQVLEYTLQLIRNKKSTSTE